MLREGIYSLDYTGEHMGERGSDSALAMLRNGRILGSDRFGVVFAGCLEADAAQGRNTVRLHLQVPPEGVLVNGFTAGPAGALVEIVAALEETMTGDTGCVEVAGRPVEIRLTYLGPLPN